MKKTTLYILTTLILTTTGCFDDQDFKIPDNLSYIAFEKTEILLLEGEVATAEARIVYSGPSLGKALSVPLSIVDEEGLKAKEGEDYTIEGGLDKVSIPAGKHEQTIQINIINNTKAVGSRVFSIGIGKIEGVQLGTPDNKASKAIKITIQEDDLTLFGYTSFEEPVAGTINNYSSSNGTDQPNVVGENSVDFSSTGGEMGFDTSYIEGQEGGADNTLLYGVTKFASDTDWKYDVGSFPDGDQAYSSSDSDGLMEIVFDELTIPANASILQVSMSLWFAKASWETDDEFDVFWRTEEGDEKILSLRANDSADMTNSADGSGENIEEEWKSFQVTIDQKKTGRLVIQIGTDSGSEINFIDNIKIEGL